jgi:hypothetical protein
MRQHYLSNQCIAQLLLPLLVSHVAFMVCNVHIAAASLPLTS